MLCVSQSLRGFVFAALNVFTCEPQSSPQNRPYLFSPACLHADIKYGSRLETVFNVSSFFVLLKVIAQKVPDFHFPLIRVLGLVKLKLCSCDGVSPPCLASVSAAGLLQPGSDAVFVCRHVVEPSGLTTEESVMRRNQGRAQGKSIASILAGCSDESV